MSHLLNLQKENLKFKSNKNKQKEWVTTATKVDSGLFTIHKADQF